MGTDDTEPMDIPVTPVSARTASPDEPRAKNQKEFVRMEFTCFAKEQLAQARMTALRKASEIRRLFSTAGVSFAETELARTSLCDLFEHVQAPTLDAFLMNADDLREEDRKNNNASPELFTTPLAAAPSVSGLPPKAPPSGFKSAKKNAGIFPSAKEIASVKAKVVKVSPSICSGMDAVYQFVGTAPLVPITPKPKAARTLKPGEMVFSQTGSPIYVPAIPNTEPRQFPHTPGNNTIGVDKPVRLQVPDPKGNFDVELVFRGGDPNDPGDGKRAQAQAFKGFVTDVRGLISTRTTVRASKRLQKLRVPVKSKSAVKKKPEWLHP